MPLRGGALPKPEQERYPLDGSTGAITPVASTAGTYTVKYTTEASAGCASVEATTPVTISPLPSAAISGEATVCVGAAAQDITFTGSNGTPPYTFTYQVNDGDYMTVSTTSESSQVTVSQAAVPGIYTYSLVSVSHANSCSQSATGSATITVNAAPVANFAYNGSMSCATGTISPTYLNGGVAGAFTSNVDGIVFSAPAGTIDLGASTPGTYTITNTISGCGADVTASTQVTITHVPTAAITGGETATCASSTLTASTDATNKTYVWYKNDAVIDGADASTYTAISGDSYKVKVINTDTGCENISASKTVNIYAAPECSITTSETEPIIYGSTYTYTTPAGMTSYAWSVSGAGEIVSDANTETVTIKTTAASPFTLSLTISNSNGCTSVCDKTVYVGQAPLTATSTVAPTVYDGTNAAGAVTLGAVSGMKNGETLDITPTAGTFADANVGAEKQVTITYSLANNTGLASNYSMASYTTTGAVTAAPLTAASTVAPKVYDGTNAAGAVTLGAVSGMKHGETLDITPTAGTFADANVGAEKQVTITYSLADETGLASNYSMASYTTTGAVTAAPLTAASTVAPKVYDGTNAAGAVTLGAVSGMKHGETLDITPTAGTFADANVGAEKQVTITYSLADETGLASNYIMDSYTTTGAVTAAPLTAASTVAPKEYDGTNAAGGSNSWCCFRDEAW